MSDVYTLGAWRVKAGRERDFVEAWIALGEFFNRLPNPPGVGTLLQSVDEPRQFYSFGPWQSLDDVQAMRAAPGAAEAIQTLVDLCEEATPGSFRVAATA